MDVIKAEADLMNAKEAEAFARFYKAHYTLARRVVAPRTINTVQPSRVRTLWEPRLATRKASGMRSFGIKCAHARERAGQ